MTAGEFIRQMVEANRDWFALQRTTRAVSNQTAYRISDLYDTVHDTYDPCFVLSTGRCGTKLLTRILDVHPLVRAVHEPVPALYYYSGYAYRHRRDGHDALKSVVDCARYTLIRDTFLTDVHYVECNNRITFFAYQLAELFPRSKFIHLIRAPLPFVQSGFSRNWYSDRVITDEGRIQPFDDRRDAWEGWTQVERIAWLWNETNAFIHEFKGTLEGGRVMTVRSEDLFADPHVAREIFAFIGVDALSERRVARFIRKPVNRQRPGRKKALTEAQTARVLSMVPMAEVFDGASRP